MNAKVSSPRPAPDLDPAHDLGVAEARVRAKCALEETPADLIRAAIPYPSWCAALHHSTRAGTTHARPEAKSSVTSHFLKNGTLTFPSMIM